MTLLDLHCEFTEEENKIIMKHIGYRANNNISEKETLTNILLEIDKL